MTSKLHFVLGTALVASVALPSNAAAESSASKLASQLAALGVEIGLRPGEYFFIGAGGHSGGTGGARRGRLGRPVYEKAKALAAALPSALEPSVPTSEHMVVRRSQSKKSIIVTTERPSTSFRPARMITERVYKMNGERRMTVVKTAKGDVQHVYPAKGTPSRRQRLGKGWPSRVKHPWKGPQRFR